MGNAPAVRFENVSKRFTIHHERARSFQDLLIHRFRRGRSSEAFWALQDISFEAAPGTALGILGSNGSGKSTLLKLATRILFPTQGTVKVEGRVSALLELGAGFHPDLSGRDNVFLNASILGMPKQEVAARFDAIVKFAELERFIDIPVKHYSSGMYARLGFAVAIHLDPSVLLIDEVLAVGDEAFQARCLESIRRFHRAGKTLLLVSHDVATICDVCTEAIWLDGGRIRAHGAPRSVVGSYLSEVRGQGLGARGRGLDGDAESSTPDPRPLAPGPHQIAPDPHRRWGSGQAEVVDVRFLDAGGNDLDTACTGEHVAIRIHYRAHERIERPVFGLAITAADGAHVTGPNTAFGGLAIPFIAGDGFVTYSIPDLLLLPGTYALSVSIYDEACAHAFDYQDRMYLFSVGPGASAERYGLVRLPGQWSHRTGAECGPRSAE